MSEQFDSTENTEESKNKSKKRVFVHRKGASKALPRFHPDLSPTYYDIGQPIPVGGSMGTASYLLLADNTHKSMDSCSHGSGRLIPRGAARKQFNMEDVNESMKNVLLLCKSDNGAIEEHPGVYKDIDLVVEAAVELGIVKRIVRVVPIAVIKG